MLSRIAATGSIRVARRAGTKPETTVATTPTTRPAITVRGSSTVLVLPRSIPNEASSAARPGASARPAAMPSSDASTPITNVSASTERSTWPREAPSVRSSANSFVRCATVTLKVLKIRKRADEQRHPGEHEQRRADEAERVREVLRLLLGLLLAGAHGELPPQLARRSPP